MKRKAFRWAIFISILLAAVLVFASCATAKPSATPTPSPTAAPTAKSSATPTPTVTPTSTSTKKVELGQATTPATSDWYAPSVAIGDFVTRNTNLVITVEAQSGPSAMEPAVQQGLCEIGGPVSLQGITSAYIGVGQYLGKPEPDLRLMLNTGNIFMGFMTTQRTGIKTMSDLKGKKLARYTTSTNDWGDALLQAYGIDPLKDVTNVMMANSSTGHDALQSGQVDAITCTLTGARVIQLQQASGNPVPIPIDADKLALAAQQNSIKVLGLFIGYIKAGEPGYGITQPVPVLSGPTMMFCNKSVSDDVVYTYVKTLLTHVKDVQGLNVLLSSFSLDIAVPIPTVPYHPGAIKAIKEANLWTDAHQKAQQQFPQ